jgi:hypothetical protein
MSIKSRLKSIEDKNGAGKPEIVFFNTYYGRRDGGLDYESGLAVIVGKTAFDNQHISSLEDETRQEFTKRACDEVFEITGVRPVNEAEIVVAREDHP